MPTVHQDAGRRDTSDGDDPGDRPALCMPRYVYRVVVGGEADDELLVRHEPVPIEAAVPFRGRTVIIEETQDLHETNLEQTRLTRRQGRGRSAPVSR